MSLIGVEGLFAKKGGRLEPTVREFAYEEALRLVADQASLLDDLRGRAGTLLSVASLLTGFLGGLAVAAPTLEDGVLTRSPISGWGWGAIVVFAIVGGLCIVILWPWRWRLYMNPIAFAASAEEKGRSLAELKWDLARYHRRNFETNLKTLRWLFRAFRLASLLLVLETVFWVLNLTG
jgi:hypothetical protein